MKQLTCAQMGGPATCTVAIQGQTPEDMVKNAMDHVLQAHPDLAEQIKKMTPEVTTKWMDDFRVKFDAAPTM